MAAQCQVVAGVLFGPGFSLRRVFRIAGQAAEVVIVELAAGAAETAEEHVSVGTGAGFSGQACQVGPRAFARGDDVTDLGLLPGPDHR